MLLVIRNRAVARPGSVTDQPRLFVVGAGEALTLLPAGLLDLACESDAHQPVVGLELLHGLGGVVDEGEAGGLAATELRAEAEDADLVLAGLVHARELLPELVLGDVGAAGVEDVTARGRKSVRDSRMHFIIRAVSNLVSIRSSTPYKWPHRAGSPSWTVADRKDSSCSDVLAPGGEGLLTQPSAYGPEEGCG